MKITKESIKFVEQLKQQTKPKWLSVAELTIYLEHVGAGAILWCVINNNMSVVPVELEVSSWTEIIKNAEVIDIELICKSIQPDGHTSDPFKVRASLFTDRNVKTGDVTRINYLTFGSFSKMFSSQAPRDEYLDELVWLDGMINDMAQAYQGRKINQFLRFLGTGKL